MYRRSKIRFIIKSLDKTKKVRQEKKDNINTLVFSVLSQML